MTTDGCLEGEAIYIMVELNIVASEESDCREQSRTLENGMLIVGSTQEIHRGLVVRIGSEARVCEKPFDQTAKSGE